MTNPSDTLTVMFSHNLWANLRLLESCATLTDDQLAAKIAGSYGSIYETLQHFVRSEQSYFSRVSTGQRINRPDNEPPMTMADMRDSLQRTGSGFIEWANKVQAQDMVVIIWDEIPRDVPKTIILTQVINHATEHREQIKAILTELGIEPPDLQAWEYFIETTG